MLCGSIDEYDRKGEKKRMILFFSGTGNSRHVAMNLASMIGERRSRYGKHDKERGAQNF